MEKIMYVFFGIIITYGILMFVDYSEVLSVKNITKKIELKHEESIKIDLRPKENIDDEKIIVDTLFSA